MNALAPSIGEFIQDRTSHRSSEYFEVQAVALSSKSITPVVYAVSASGNIMCGPVVKDDRGYWDALRVTTQFFPSEESEEAAKYFYNCVF